MNSKRATKADKRKDGSGCTRGDFQQGMKVRIVKGQNEGKIGFVTRVNNQKLTVKENLNDIRWMNPLFDHAEPIRRAGLPSSLLSQSIQVLPIVVIVDTPSGYLDAIAGWGLTHIPGTEIRVGADR